MNSDFSTRQTEFFCRLDELDVGPAQLRADPRGATWLPSDLACEIDHDPELARWLSVFVEQERAAFSGASAKPDAWFTSRVLSALPSQPGVCSTTRSIILGFCYSLAAFVLYISIEAGGASEQLHPLYGDLGEVAEPKGVGDLSMLAVVMAACLVAPFLGRMRMLSRRECQTVYTPAPGHRVQA